MRGHRWRATLWARFPGWVRITWTNAREGRARLHAGGSTGRVDGRGHWSRCIDGGGQRHGAHQRLSQGQDAGPMDRAQPPLRSALEHQQIRSEYGHGRTRLCRPHVALRHALLRHHHRQHETGGGAGLRRQRQGQGQPAGGVHRFSRYLAESARHRRCQLESAHAARRNPRRRRVANRHARHRHAGHAGHADPGCPAGHQRSTLRPMKSPLLHPRGFTLPNARGFTLVELLIALLILGIMSALGYGTYRAARISAERTEESLKRSREIEFGMRVLVMDFAQLVPRPVRDALGQSRLPALRGSQGNGTSAGTEETAASSSSSSSSSMHFDSGPGFQSSSSGSTSNSTNSLPLAELSRGGWSNTAGQQRSTLQRVSYALVDDVLKRSYTTALDTVQGSKPVVQDLLSGVKTVQFRYLDGNQAWQNAWPPPTVQPPDSWRARPIAVEVTIEFKDWGRVRRLIEVAG